MSKKRLIILFAVSLLVILATRIKKVVDVYDKESGKYLGILAKVEKDEYGINPDTIFVNVSSNRNLPEVYGYNRRTVTEKNRWTFIIGNYDLTLPHTNN